ncbi:MAG: RDD family protein [Planctomycetes bacterium]|nr:RDD family protein [Planctomycetota bacterium]
MPLQAIDTLARIETPESAWLTFRLAGPWTRMVAYGFDFLLRLLVLAAIGLVFGFLAGLFGAAPLGLLLLGFFALEWGYAWFFEAFWDGKTPGKHVMQIRVVKTSGSPIGFYDAMLRNLLRAADVLPPIGVLGPSVGTYGVGLGVMLATRRFQRLGDLVAGTMVVHVERPELRTSFAALRGNIKPLERARLAAGYRPPERVLELIDRLYRRRREMHPRRAAEIAALLAPRLRERLGYEDLEGLHTRSPALFLLRVLRTFAAEDEAGGDGWTRTVPVSGRRRAASREGSRP